MSASRYVYGLVVSSDRDLFPFAREAEPGDSPDVRILFAEDVAEREPAGEFLLSFDREGVSYVAVRHQDGTFRLAFRRSCEFRITADFRTVTVHRYPGAKAGIENVLASGAQMAFQLYLRGTLVLHASAVQLGDSAIAFTGGSGRGKSTMATLLCGDGARILTDDILAVDWQGDTPVGRVGSPDIRLRKGAEVLADSFSDNQPERRTSADARQILTPASRADAAVPVRAIYLPIPSRELERTEIRRLRATDALFVLVNTPRLFGWVDVGVRSQQFEMMAKLVESVPVSLVHVPWGPPFSTSIATAIAADSIAERSGSTLEEAMTLSGAP